ncbi:MAG TPA: hypothetical protein VFS94_03785, partial [Gemmatimonadales bacterium]|nr:hypothetical protein [Gemmatimonadales bacterium]
MPAEPSRTAPSMTGLGLLVDPVSGLPLEYEPGPAPALVSDSGARYPVVDGIPRFVESAPVPAEQASTADTFSLKWSRV